MTDGGWGNAFRDGSSDGMGAYRDTLLEPVFRPWAQLLLTIAEPTPGESVLDVATGPGTVAQAVAPIVGASGKVTACDISPAMLAIARVAAQDPLAAPIEYIEAPASSLPAADESQDLVTCQQGLQFVPDRAAAVAEMMRVLRPGGRLVVAVWAAIEECPTMFALESAVREHFGDEPGDRYRSGPWGQPDGASWAELLTTTGFAEVHVAKHALTAVFPGGAAQLTASLAASAVAGEVAGLSPADKAVLDQRIAHHLELMTVRGGGVEAPLHSNIVVGVKPGVPVNA